MTTLTIQTVDPATRTWEGPKGTIEFIQGQFTNGEGWSLGAKPENAAKRVAELTALIGVEGEYELEPKGEFRGKPQHKMKGWPGKPVFGGGGGNKAPRDETGMAIGAAGHDAAVLVAAMIGSNVVFPNGDPFGLYADLTKRIYENNQSLRSATLPAKAETGAGASPPPASNTSPADEAGRGEKTVSRKDQGAAGAEWGAKPEGKPADAPCSHKLWTEFKPDNETKLPTGFRRCTTCNAMSDKKGVFK